MLGLAFRKGNNKQLVFLLLYMNRLLLCLKLSKMKLRMALAVEYPSGFLPALNVVDQAEVFSGFLDLDDVHESNGELGLGPDLAVDLRTRCY